MKAFIPVIGLASCAQALAFPYDAASQIPLGAVPDVISNTEKLLLSGKQQISKWYDQGKTFIKENELLYELVQHTSPTLDAYQLRIKEPKLCDPSVKQYSGYLDIEEDKHLFFWFFESRNSPSTDPLILWLNGGPGCSSSAGLLFELGPCLVTDEGHNVTWNEWSWNTNANIIFLDQPVNVGYSYADNGKTVNNSPVVGKDVYAFLELFFERFPQYSKLPFHLAAESYGGTYAPNIASVIFSSNKNPAPGLRKINLASVILANGLTDPYIQAGSLADYVCNGPYPIYSDPDSPECQALRTKIPTCQRLIKACYNFESRLSCVPATLYCNSLVGPLIQTGVNPYDVRQKCDRATDGDLCYKQMSWVETFLDNPSVKAELGVSSSINFESCNMEVNQAFALQGDSSHNAAKLLPELVNGGVRLLVYAGHADMMCNYIGNERWVEALPSVFHDAFAASDETPWLTRDTGIQAGLFRTAGSGAGNVTFVNVFNAGHMVPFDVPEAAFDLISRWIEDVPLA